jgi:hypothetical protein
MSDYESTQDRELTTEQIAAAGTTPDQQDMQDMQDMQAPTGYPGYEDNTAAPLVEGNTAAPLVEDDSAAPLVADHAAFGEPGRGTPRTGNGASAAAEPKARARLLEDGELQSITARWKDIQAEFVEEPTVAVQQADALVAELMQRLAVMFATERADLENRLAGSNEVTTEDLRQGLRRYRSFFERLLAA